MHSVFIWQNIRKMQIFDFSEIFMDFYTETYSTTAASFN